MKSILLHSLYFIITLNIGALANEKFQLFVANQLGFEAQYDGYFDHYIYYDTTFIEARDSEKIKNLLKEELIEKDLHNRRKIEMFEKTFLYLLSLMFLFLYRKFKSLWLIIPAFIFMRDVIYNAFYITFDYYLCTESSCWGDYSDFIIVHYLSVIVGLIFLSFLISQIPKKMRFPIIVSGLIGSVIGGIIWVFYLGNLLLG